MKNAVRIFLLLSAAIAFPADANEPESFYRVEIIVFQHANGRSDAHPAEKLEDFSELTDPLDGDRTPSAMVDVDADPDGPGDSLEPETGRREETRTAMEALELISQLEEGSLGPALPKWPEPYVALESLSGRMHSARERLERSPDYRPLTWLAWHQPIETDRAVSRVRVHDETVIDTQTLSMAPTGVPVINEVSVQGGNAFQPHFHYRLDGGIRLYRRQFMHAEVNLHWRERLVLLPGGSYPEQADSGLFEIHRLEQSRTIRAGRVEYFDSNWLGLLILVEEIEPLDGSGDNDENENVDSGG